MILGRLIPYSALVPTNSSSPSFVNSIVSADRAAGSVRCLVGTEQFGRYGVVQSVRIASASISTFHSGLSSAATTTVELAGLIPENTAPWARATASKSPALVR